MSFPGLPFASVPALERRWKRTLTLDEEEHAQTLLRDASLLIMAQCPRASDASIEVLEMVTCSVVKRAMTTVDTFGAESFQQSAGPYGGQLKFANPTGDLYLSKSEKRTLGCNRQRFFSVQLGGADAGDNS